MDRRTTLIGLAATGGSILAAGVAKGLSLFKAGVAVKLEGVKAPAPVRTAGHGPIRSVSVGAVPLGAGGYITGIDASADGSRFVCRADVCNAYVRNRDDPAWQPLFSPETMARADYDPLPARNKKADGPGVGGVRIAPSNRDVIYATYLGYVWRSSDGGKSIRRTSTLQKTVLPNSGAQRLFNRTLDVDPHNPDHVLWGTWGDGAYFSQDGGKNWRQLALPAALPDKDKRPGICQVLFDPADPRRIYVAVAGIGLFASESGADGPFTAIGGPARCSQLLAGPAGAVILCEFTGTDASLVWTYRPGAGWTSSKPMHEMRTLAIDPRDSRHMVGSGAYGFGMRTADGGAGWKTQSLTYTPQGGEIGWIGAMETLSVAEMIWDPHDPGALLLAHGVGVCRIDATTGVMRDWSAGIEELCAVSGLSVPGGKTFLTNWDKPIWRLDHETSYLNVPTYPHPQGDTVTPDVLTNGTFLDHAGDDPNFMVAVVNVAGRYDHKAGPGFSTDGGENWQTFAGVPPRGWGYGGCIAASTRSNYILLPSNNGYGAYTLDGGRTWLPLQLDGVNDTSHFTNAFYVPRRAIAADKTRPGVFVLVYTTMQPGPDPYGNPLGGVWLTKDGGQSWNLVLRGVINDAQSHDPKRAPPKQDARQFWRCNIEYVPGHSGELVYTGYGDYDDDRFWWSRDDGQSWRELHSSIRRVVGFGFGKNRPDQTRPAIFFSGDVDDVNGLYASFDWFATKPVLVTRFPNVPLCPTVWVTGDINRFGRVYIGTGGGGWSVIDVELAAA
ncbi:MAG: hypothetical protein JSR96_00700 [Proteobacteria bacterium]|nr:hypothetical protein [Pseudomonadota bacterium]